MGGHWIHSIPWEVTEYTPYRHLFKIVEKFWSECFKIESLEFIFPWYWYLIFLNPSNDLVRSKHPWFTMTNMCYHHKSWVLVDVKSKIRLLYKMDSMNEVMVFVNSILCMNNDLLMLNLIGILFVANYILSVTHTRSYGDL